MGFLIDTLMAAFGLRERTARALATVGLVLVILLSMWGGKCAYDAAVISRHDAERERKAAPARDTASDQRVRDAVTNAKSEEELHHAIDTAPPGGTLSPAARALSCERLRRIGRVPAACRPEGGDGGQAHPDGRDRL